MPPPRAHLSYEQTDSAPTRWVIFFVLLSLLAHALIFLVILLLSIFVPPPKFEVPPAKKTPTTLSIVAPPPQKRLFMPTNEQKDVKPKDTQIESDHNTVVKSQSKKDRTKDSVMPDVESKVKNSSQMQNQPLVKSQDHPTTPSTQPSPKPTEPKPNQPPQPTPPQQQTAQTKQPQPAPPTPKPPKPGPPKPPTPKVVTLAVDPETGLPLLPPISAPTLAPQSAPSTESSAPPPVDPAVAANMEGRAGMSGQPSPEAMETELGKYKAIVYRAVGSRWYQKVANQLQVLGVGIVRVRYTISSDGTVSTQVLSGGDSNTMLLLSLSVNSIREAAPFPVFSPTLIAELSKLQGGDGKSFTDDFSFSIYGGG